VFSGFDPTLPELQFHPREFITTTQVVASGEINGSIPMAQHVTGGINRKWVHDFRLDGEGDAGIIFELDFNLDGSTMFHYKLPFQITLEIPKTVYAGQSFYLKARSFQLLGTSTLAVDHTLDSSTDHRIWVNVPYDFMSPVDILLSQQPDKLIVSAKLPLSPDLPPTEIGWPFNTGEYSFDGVTVKLGGHTDFNTVFDHIQTLPDGILQIWTGETRTSGVWSLIGDQIRLLSEIPIPVVGQVAAGLTLAKVKLNHNTNLNVRSTDFIQMKPPFLYDFLVYAPFFPLGTVPLHKNFSLDMNGSLLMDTIYEMATGITFDMPFIDPITIADWPLMDIFHQLRSEGNWFSANFTLDFQVEVLPKVDWMVIYAPDIPIGGEVHLANYTPSEASAESNRIASLVFPNPPEPPIIIPPPNPWTFLPKPESEFALMLAMIPSAGGTVMLDPLPVDGGYSNGTVVTMTAKVASGYQFAGWGGDIIGLVNPVTITMNDIKSVMANFTAAPPYQLYLPIILNPAGLITE
jgi:hypothetical protein